MDWDDVVLHPDTLRQIREIENWIGTTTRCSTTGA